MVKKAGGIQVPHFEKQSKPKIGDAIGNLLYGDNLSRAQEFIAFLKDNKINTQWTNTCTWKAVRKGITICYIKAGFLLNDGNLVLANMWTITTRKMVHG
jgi:hypothetical protein